MPVRKIAKIVDAAFKDGAAARRAAQSPKWARAQQKDRREVLRKFVTVEQTIAERDRQAKATAKAKKKKKK
jgi:hypothetical protein